MRKTVTIKVYGPVDPKKESQRRRNGTRLLRRPSLHPITTSVKAATVNA